MVFSRAKRIRRGGSNHYQEEQQTPLYEWSGFPQEVQGKRGENCGESANRSKLFVISRITYIKASRLGTSSPVWSPKCDFRTIDFSS